MINVTKKRAYIPRGMCIARIIYHEMTFPEMNIMNSLIKDSPPNKPYFKMTESPISTIKPDEITNTTPSIMPIKTR